MITVNIGKEQLSVTKENISHIHWLEDEVVIHTLKGDNLTVSKETVAYYYTDVVGIAPPNAKQGNGYVTYIAHSGCNKGGPYEKVHENCKIYANSIVTEDSFEKMEFEWKKVVSELKRKLV